MLPARDVSRLIEIMRALRTPETGCAWDCQQDFASIAPYAIEEAYEVADAIARGDVADLTDELGDLLLQVVFQAQIAAEAGLFEFGDVVHAITAKLIRRHPHVFGDARHLPPDEVKLLWQEIKADEKADRAQRRGLQEAEKLLDDIPIALPGLSRAVKIQAKAASVGFDWNDPMQVVAKIREETDEIEAALKSGTRANVADEIGDTLFALANLARHMELDPDACLRGTNAKFERRFGHVETVVTQRGGTLQATALEEMERLWQEAKQSERAD